ncbi:cell division protein FtsZ [Candidatus Persebacteraceae bacterium Df01]|jgi:cell division protein FtsZ|uniref:Cell division protein FtsZ n=1 Tax=Candidatus Doriopsillibacter californiensis TaxID=2970740 RepID=A0ABT7QKZ1_9GAMM|nr:cell division protein FtsZ [Candidatus Persebacteraceae bacterium Df01]
MSIQFLDNTQSPARIRVIGVGGCGGNIIRYLQDRHVSGIEYAAVNTDSQALASIQGVECVHIGEGLTRGLGAGADPKLAAQAAEEESRRLQELVRGCDMVFITAGMGKGTGTGASPIIARLAREEKALTVAVVTSPFDHERRGASAINGIEALSKEVDSLLVVPNAKLQDVLGNDVMLKDALAAANGVLYNAVCGISEIITKPGEMNLDFNDVRAVMSAKGKAVMGSACATGTDRATAAAQEALCCPLMEDVDLSSASHFLVNITASGDYIRLSEADAVHAVIDEKAPNCRNERFVGLVYDESMGEEIRVTIIATGINGEAQAMEFSAAAVGGGAPDLEVIRSGIKDPCFMPARQRHRQEQLREKLGGDERKVPTIMRRQCN